VISELADGYRANGGIGMAVRKTSGRQKSPIGFPAVARGPASWLSLPVDCRSHRGTAVVVYCYPYAENSAMAAAIQTYLSTYAKIVGTVISALDP